MNSNLIYDVGMYDGADTAYYLSKGYNVISVEADPVLAQKASVRFKQQIRKGQLKIINEGIAPESGEALFYINEVNPFWNSFDERISSRDNLPYHPIPIVCSRFKDILQTHGVPYYLKIDIEGNDKYCIQDLDSGNLPQYISFEADNEGNTEMLDMARGLGYAKFKCVNQHTFLPLNGYYSSKIDPGTLSFKDLLFLKIKTAKNLPMKILRKLVLRKLSTLMLKPSNYLTFYRGSSGPFGKDLEGEWLTYEEVKSVYLRSYEDYLKKKSGNYGFWCDFHATL